MVSQRGIPQSEQFYNENFMYVVQVQWNIFVWPLTKSVLNMLRCNEFILF
jgi:hypothetical protein